MNRESVLSSGACAARVRRYHTWPMTQTQTVGQHAARVAILYVEIFGLPRAEVLYYALRHDDGELYAGDVPSYGKHDVPELGEALNRAEQIGLENLGVKLPILESDEYLRVKICDYLELWEHCSVDLHMGNKYARPAVNYAYGRALEIVAKSQTHGDEERVRNWYKKETRRYAEW